MGKTSAGEGKAPRARKPRASARVAVDEEALSVIGYPVPGDLVEPETTREHRERWTGHMARVYSCNAAEAGRRYREMFNP